MPTRLLVAVILAAGCFNSPVSGDEILDLIPADASAAIVIRNLDEIIEKGDKLIADAEIRMNSRPSDLFKFGYGYLGINRSVDKGGSAAVVLAGSEKAEGDLDEVLNRLVIIVPFRELDEIAADFGFARGTMEPQTLAVGKAKTFGTHFYARGKHLYVGLTEKAVLQVAQGPSLRSAMSKDQAAAFNRADLLMHFNPSELEADWNKRADKLANELSEGMDADEQKVTRQLVQALQGMKFTTLAVYVEDSLRFHSATAFDVEKSADAKALLARLSSEPGASDLIGLPTGNVLAAQAVQGEGSANSAILKALLKIVTPRLALMEPSLRYASRPAFLGVFAEIWQQLKGSRVAVYLNDNEAEQGLLSAVAILDTEDPQRFLNEIGELAKFAAQADEIADGGKTIDAGEIRRVIEDLGSEDFEARQSATTKLTLMGEPALPYLKDAVGVDDRELSERARELAEYLQRAAAERRKALLSDDPYAHVEPKFAYVPPGPAGVDPVHVMQVRLSGKDEQATPQLQQLFGPDWNKIRMIPLEKHVVVLFGSDRRLLDKAAQNLKSGKPGLAGDPSLSTFPAERNARKVQFHLSLAKVKTLTGDSAAIPQSDTPVEASKGTFSSFGLSIHSTMVVIDLIVPPQDLKALVKNGYWW